jgi:hypothetical protein
MILILRTHLSLMRDSEQVELFVGWANPGCGVWHVVGRLGKAADASCDTMQETLSGGKVWLCRQAFRLELARLACYVGS